ncbi:hypothetical protein CCR94_07830 [Rhodoblastus sphagnicola]|uniref:Uncharacterized protein n=1 Tax=Rhodoblastus sphagnicola TaxID=333368 RepID=A0A2S6NBA9_9HYPH|nr:hypothetical protein [Rhodoblastus sphagnicola]MBB4197726.1 hypothetical protein [Rhodoblastus sphagnicola]PPQ31874.1 hypothetical protein CCR94_07830 [Rhodoblastus sphagnicola]
MSDRTKPKSRHLNRDQKRALQAAAIGRFLRQYGRKTRANLDPNDRNYDRDIECKLKKMKPALLGRLMYEDED